jgi:hypothetical protein
MADDFVSDTSESPSGYTRAAVRTDDNQVDIVFIRIFHYFMCRFSIGYNRADK